MGIRIARRPTGGKRGVERILASRQTNHSLDAFLSLCLIHLRRVVWSRSLDIKQDNLDVHTGDSYAGGAGNSHVDCFLGVKGGL